MIFILFDNHTKLNDTQMIIYIYIYIYIYLACYMLLVIKITTTSSESENRRELEHRSVLIVLISFARRTHFWLSFNFRRVKNYPRSIDRWLHQIAGIYVCTCGVSVDVLYVAVSKTSRARAIYIYIYICKWDFYTIFVVTSIYTTARNFVAGVA